MNGRVVNEKGVANRRDVKGTKKTTTSKKAKKKKK
jgi:hypothetical protein